MDKKMEIMSGLTSIVWNVLASFVYEFLRNRNETFESIADKAIGETNSHFEALGVVVDKNDLKRILFSSEVETEFRNFSMLTGDAGINSLVARFASLSSFYIPDESERIERVVAIVEYLFSTLNRLLLIDPRLSHIYMKRCQDLGRMDERREHQEIRIDLDRVHATLAEIKRTLGDLTETIVSRIEARSLDKKEQIELIQRVLLEPIQDYLPRKVCSVEHFSSSGFSMFADTLSFDLTDLINRNGRIALLGDAGVGKTKELHRVAYCFSNADSPFFPFVVHLNSYVDQSLPDFLPPSWGQIPEEQLLIILDGLDEIENKNRNDAIRQIELFSEQHPHSHLVISCRTNFYESETDDWPGSLQGFSSFILLNLTDKEIKQYLETKLGSSARRFEKSIIENNLEELIRIPFYLIRLVELFQSRSNLSLPKNNAEIFDELLASSMKRDIEHFRTTIALGEKKKMILQALERLALGMEMLGRNYITIEELQQLIPDDSLRSLTEYCTAFKKNDGGAKTWKFEHNNFQEYLAAKALAKQSFQTIKDLISFEPKHLKVNPSWLNTLSFLISLLDKESTLFVDMVNWVKEIEPEIVVKFEADRIDKSVRLHLFRSIFEDYKRKQVWINRDKFPIRELARFGQAIETTDYLVIEIESASHYTTLCNAIRLLGNLKVSYSQRQKVTDILLRCATDHAKGENVQSDALIALANLELNSKEVIDGVLAQIRPTDDDQVRFALYYFLHSSEHNDEYIDVFLDGIGPARRNLFDANKTILLDEQMHLKHGIEKAKSPDAIKKIFDHFTKHPEDLDLSFDTSIPIIIDNAVKAYAEDVAVFDAAAFLIQRLMDNFLENEAEKFLPFFQKTNTQLRAFQALSMKEETRSIAYRLLVVLTTAECLRFVIEQYRNGEITDKDVGYFQRLLSRSQDNQVLHIEFERILNEEFDDRFILPPKMDFGNRRMERQQRDFDLLFSKQMFLDEIKHVFDVEGKREFIQKELYELEAHNFENTSYSHLVLRTLIDLAVSCPVSFEDSREYVNRWNWEPICVSQIYNQMTQNRDLSISQEQREDISKWCFANLAKVDFQKALVQKENGLTASPRAVNLWYFLRRLSLKFPQEVLLDLLLFDWIEGNGFVGISYLEEMLPDSAMSLRILKNFEEGIRIETVLMNHLNYCRRHNIEDVLKFARAELISSARGNETRRIALEVICEQSDSLSELEELLPEVADDFKWNVIEQLFIRKSKMIHDFLSDVLANGSENDKLKAAEYLIKLQDINGLQYYAERIKDEGRFVRDIRDDHPLKFLQDIQAVPTLIDLLEFSYTNRTNRDDDGGLNSAVLEGLTNIALKSPLGIDTVKEAVTDFIEANSSSFQDVSFLHLFLERLEQNFYLNFSNKLTIHDAIEKLEKLSYLDTNLK